MDARFVTIAAIAASQHAVVSLDQLIHAGVTKSLRHQWIAAGLLRRIGPRSSTVAGSAPMWRRELTGGWFDLAGRGFVAGRSAPRLAGLDGFLGDHLEFLVSRKHRVRPRSAVVVRSTSRPIDGRDVRMIDGLRVLSVERLILDSPLFGFTRSETENAIDSALRLRLVSQQRLRARVIERHSRGVNGGRVLLDALVDSGGESRLERMFLELLREARMVKPELQKVFRSDGRTVARVDVFFAGGLVVELAGHGTHATRAQRQHDAQRHTELTLRGLRVLAFTYEDIRDRPGWVLARIRDGLRTAA